jgi:Ca2+-binding RTX toxin-like protein
MSLQLARRFRQVHVQPLEPRRLLSFTPGPEMTVTGGAGGAGFDVAVGGDRGYMVAASIARGEVHRVTAFRYAASGEQIGDPITLYSYIPTFPQRTAHIAASIDADGDAVVAYGVYDDLVNAGLYFNRISKTGEVSRTVKVTNIDNAPLVSMDAGGGFFLAWRVQGEDHYVARAFDAAGVPRASQFNVVSMVGIGSIGTMDLVARPDGTGAVFAAERSYDSDSGHVQDRIAYGRTSTSAVVSAVVEFNEPFDMSQPAVAVHSDGSFVIGYRRIDQVNRALRSVHVRRFNADGGEVGGPVRIGGTLPSDGNGTHSVALDDAPDGGFVTSFVQTVGSADTIYAASFDAAVAVDESGYVPIATDVAPANTFGDGRFVPRIGAEALGSAVVGYVMRSGDEVRHRQPAGDDVLTELRGAELFVNGTEGNDHIIVERVRENLFVNVNGLVERFNASAVQFLSVNGFASDDDIVNATALPATIHGGDGADTIWGGVGPDRIRGFGGNDALRGGDGADQLFGDAGSDLLNGGDDNDELLGDLGEDTLIGSTGNDVLRGHRGSDALHGEAGGDTLDGGDAGDYLEGGAGHDALTGGAGADALFGLAGNDRLFAADDFADTVRGGAGDDAADADALDDVLTVETIT